MFDTLRNKLQEVVADVNPWDGGKNAASVRASRMKPAPSQAPPQPAIIATQPRPLPQSPLRASALNKMTGIPGTYVPIPKGKPQVGPNLADNIRDTVSKVADNTLGAAHRASTLLGENIVNFPKRVIETIDQNDGESQADALLKNAAAKYKYTPEFKNRIYNSNPEIVKGGINGQGSFKDSKSEATGIRLGQGLHRIQLSDKSEDLETTLLHEGLHDEFGRLQDSQKKKFFDLYDRASKELPSIYSAPDAEKRQTVTRSGLSNYMTWRLNGYKERPDRVTDARTAPESIQNELHSYLPEYFAKTKAQMPDYLKDYYANYYDTGGKPSGVERKSDLQLMFERIFR